MRQLHTSSLSSETQKQFTNLKFPSPSLTKSISVSVGIEQGIFGKEQSESILKTKKKKKKYKTEKMILLCNNVQEVVVHFLYRLQNSTRHVAKTVATCNFATIS